MAHRLLHSLVFSSIVVLKGVGCSSSHYRGGDSASPDASFDAERALEIEAGVTADASPGAFDADDPRLCEPGWPTTKALVCTRVEEDVLCCHRQGLDDERCCTASER